MSTVYIIILETCQEYFLFYTFMWHLCTLIWLGNILIHYWTGKYWREEFISSRFCDINMRSLNIRQAT